MKTEKAIDKQMRVLIDQGFLPVNEIKNYYDIQRRRIIDKYKAGQTNAKSTKTFLGYYDIDEQAAIKKVKPDAEELWEAVIGEMRKDFSATSDKLSASLVDEVIKALPRR